MKRNVIFFFFFLKISFELWKESAVSDVSMKAVPDKRILNTRTTTVDQST